jgi:MOSC domain-containing protein YiiM
MTGLNPDSPLARLMDSQMQPGRVAWIGLRPERRTPMLAVDTARLTLEDGLVGDRYRSKGARTRQVSLIAVENLVAIKSFMALQVVVPEQLRRNIVVSGVNLLALKGRRFRIGSALLEYTGECHPCSRMEETLGEGGYNAVRGHGGITARVVESGEVQLGDPVSRSG